jgi:hypothetical protein
MLLKKINEILVKLSKYCIFNNNNNTKMNYLKIIVYFFIYFIIKCIQLLIKYKIESKA